MIHPSPQPVIVPTETVRRGEVQTAEARVRWRKRPYPRPQGWHNAALEINGTVYAAECFFTTDDDTGHVWQVIDLRRPDGEHYRLTIGPDGTRCDCPPATYRGVVCKHVAAVEEALDQLESLERAEWAAARAAADLDAARAVMHF
jgi:SWIM zinc finger